MRKLIFRVILCTFFTPLVCLAQEINFWRTSTTQSNVRRAFREDKAPSDYRMFLLDLPAFKAALENGSQRSRTIGQDGIILAFPNSNGGFDKFKVFEANVLHPDLMAKYPGIKSYVGQGINDPTATIRFSISEQRGLHVMVRSGGKGTEYIDPNAGTLEEYIVYSRNSLPIASEQLKCLTDEVVKGNINLNRGSRLRTDDKKLRKYRLALSCTAEYGNIFAGEGTDSVKKANILAQMNITMTRVNGIYENDLAITMELVPSNDKILFYGDVKADPWNGEYNDKTQKINDDVIGSDNYDIGHNFNTTGGGNAGCIGCVCKSGSKGSGFTGRADPTGDAFDVDYVAHEMGHQFGGYHTMNTCSRSGSGSTEVEPTSGSTIMGYAGICQYNIQSNSDDYFNYVNIRDISKNVQTGASSVCAQVKGIQNEAPTANAGKDYVIPKSTPFVLHGEGSDPDGDALTYTWEQNDPEKAPSNGLPEPTWAQGPLFRSIKGTASPDRYIPALEKVLAGNLTSGYEVLPSVARTMNFALTVRDNKAGGGQTGDDLMKIAVDGNSGPFKVLTPAADVVWRQGQTKTVKWDVAGTDTSAVNCAKVTILLSTDGGYTYADTLLTSTDNDGSESVMVPNVLSSTCRIMVKAVGNIFYDISNADFTIMDSVACSTNVPDSIIAYKVGETHMVVKWGEVPGASSYTVQYKAEKDTVWTEETSTDNAVELSGLLIDTKYTIQVKSHCPEGGGSEFSSPVEISTLPKILEYCSSFGGSVTDEYIGMVQLNSFYNPSFDQPSSGYSDYTSISIDLAKGDSVELSIVPVWTGTVYGEAYAVWIDYNQDGDFDDLYERVFEKSASEDSIVGGVFIVPDTTLISMGSTRMRVSMKYNAIPAPCGEFSYGEVEDYTVNIVSDTVKDEALSKGSAVLGVKVREITRNIYPIPARRFLHIDYNVSEIQDVRVASLSGSQINSVTRIDNTLDVSSLRKGVYVISIVTNEGVIKRTFVKE